MAWIIRAVASGLVGFATPRVAIAAGIPIDKWAVAMGEWLGASVSPEAALWGVTLAIGIALFGVESWRHPFQRLWGVLFGATRHKARTADMPAKRDVWLLDALFYIVTRQWGEQPRFENDVEHINQIHDACRDVGQAALDGDLPIWGRRGYSGMQEKLPPEYWKHYQIDVLQVMGLSDPEELTVEKTSHASPPWGRYEALMTCRARIEQAWPPENT